jgi:hypothetical protein
MNDFPTEMNAMIASYVVPKRDEDLTLHEIHAKIRKLEELAKQKATYDPSTDENENVFISVQPYPQHFYVYKISKKKWSGNISDYRLDETNNKIYNKKNKKVGKPSKHCDVEIRGVDVDWSTASVDNPARCNQGFDE